MTKLGYTIGEKPKQKHIIEHHTLITGATGESGKSTAMSGLISRWKTKTFIVFRTKRGELLFPAATNMSAFFREPSKDGMWRYVESMIEATMQEKNRIIRSTIMQVCEGAETLEAVWNKVKQKLKKAKGFEYSMLVQLNEYLKMVLPELQKYRFQKSLLAEGGHQLDIGKVYVMDLTEFNTDLQSMIIGAVADEVMKHRNNTVIVIPEAWEHVPNGRNTPAKFQVENLVRKGRVLGNFLVADSQEIVGIHPPIRKNISNWILGKQGESIEAEKTIDLLPLPPHQKPKPHEVQTLRLGQFLTVVDGKVEKVFAQPDWMSDEDAIKCAKEPEYAYVLRANTNVGAILDKDYYAIRGMEPPSGSIEDEQQPYVFTPQKTIEPLMQKEPTDEGGYSMRALKDALIDLIDQHIKEVTADVRIEGSSTTINTEQAEVTVIEKQVVKADIDESTMEGRLAILGAEGFFELAKNTKDIYTELDKRYGLGMSYESFRKNGIAPKSMEFWINRPYGYFERNDSGMFVITELGKKFLHKKTVEVAAQ